MSTRGVMTNKLRQAKGRRAGGDEISVGKFFVGKQRVGEPGSSRVVSAKDIPASWCRRTVSRRNKGRRKVCPGTSCRRARGQRIELGELGVDKIAIIVLSAKKSSVTFIICCRIFQ